MSGTGLYDDNGTLVEVGPGDVMVCPEGEEHAIENTGSEDIVMIALILFDRKD